MAETTSPNAVQILIEKKSAEGPPAATIQGFVNSIHINYDNAGEKSEYKIMLGPDGRACGLQVVVNSEAKKWAIAANGPVVGDQFQTDVIQLTKDGKKYGIYIADPAQQQTYGKLIQDLQANMSVAIHAAEEYGRTHPPGSPVKGPEKIALPQPPLPLNDGVSPKVALPPGIPGPAQPVNRKYDYMNFDGHKYVITLTDGKPSNITEDGQRSFGTIQPNGQVRIDGFNVTRIGDPNFQQVLKGHEQEFKDAEQRLNNAVQEYTKLHSQAAPKPAARGGVPRP